MLDVQRRATKLVVRMTNLDYSKRIVNCKKNDNIMKRNFDKRDGTRSEQPARKTSDKK